MDSFQLRTNYIPSDEEIKDIQLDIISRSKALAHLDERIRELAAERDEIQAYIDSRKALISHPRRLPADIVQEIFIACLPTSRNAVMSTQEAPLLLCRICSAWRSIALSTPRLWASLHVPYDFVLSKESRISAVAQWLQRSSACPMSISVRDADEWKWVESDREALNSSLCAVADRWRHAAFDKMSPELIHELTQIESPLLESFEFSGRISKLSQLNFFQVPSLRTVTLDLEGSESLNEFILTMPLIWHQLQHLTITSGTGMSTSTLATLLGRCPQLSSIYITPIIDDLDSDSFPPEPILPCLASFGTSSSPFVTPRSLDRLISHVSMPQLREFNVTATMCQDKAQHSFFLATLGKKSPLVKDLTIYLPSLTAQSLPETLQSFPSLDKLVVFDTYSRAWDNNGFQSCTLAQLLSILSDVTTCPVLRELEVHDCVGLNSKSVLDKFIRQRMESVHRLRRLEILFARSWAFQVLDLMSETEIQSYRSRGLDISLVYDTSWMTVPADPWTGLSDDS